MPLKQMGLKKTETALPLGARGSRLIHLSLDRPHSPPKTTARLVHALPHNATKSPFVTICHRLNSPPKLLLPPSTINTQSNTPIPLSTALTTPHQTAPGSARLFYHNTVCGQTDRQMVQTRNLHHKCLC